MDLRTVVRIPDTTRPNQISFELMFDTFEEGRSVRELTDKVATLALVHQELHRPPTALLTRGTGLAFKCILASSKVGFTLFLDDGTPVRAVMATRFQVLLDDCTLGTLAIGETYSTSASDARRYRAQRKPIVVKPNDGTWSPMTLLPQRLRSPRPPNAFMPHPLDPRPSIPAVGCLAQ